MNQEINSENEAFSTSVEKLAGKNEQRGRKRKQRNFYLGKKKTHNKNSNYC